MSSATPNSQTRHALVPSRTPPATMSTGDEPERRGAQHGPLVTGRRGRAREHDQIRRDGRSGNANQLPAPPKASGTASATKKLAPADRSRR